MDRKRFAYADWFTLPFVTAIIAVSVAGHAEDVMVVVVLLKVGVVVVFVIPVKDAMVVVVLLKMGVVVVFAISVKDMVVTVVDEFVIDEIVESELEVVVLGAVSSSGRKERRTVWQVTVGTVLFVLTITLGLPSMQNPDDPSRRTFPLSSAFQRA